MNRDVAVANGRLCHGAITGENYIPNPVMTNRLVYCARRQWIIFFRI